MGYLSVQKPGLQITAGGNKRPLPTAGAAITGMATAGGSSWVSLLSPTSRTAASVILPECQSEPAPPGSQPFTVSPQMKRSSWSSPLPPLRVLFQQHRSPQHRTSAPVHKSFPLLLSSLHHLANTNSSFQTHLELSPAP